MKKLIVTFLILTIHIFHSQSKIYAFVGKKISVERVEPDDTFNLKYKNVYKVEQTFDDEIKTDTLVFNSYTHMNQIRYSAYDYAIIYLVKSDNGELIHQRTYYTPIILKKNGKWYGFNFSDQNIDGYEKISNEYLNIMKNLAIGKTIISLEEIKQKSLINAFYPKKFFTPINKNKIKIKYLKSAEKLYQSN